MNSPGYPGSPEGLAAPPPPPPPPVPGQVPTLRISTASELGPRRPQLSAGAQDPYEPPAAIQNAMMTKDKKPFTYTPGMGGKLDLSQIRSPRMARRVAKNANDEGIEGPPKELATPMTPQGQVQQQPSLYSHPQVAIPVFPQGQQSGVNLRNSTLPRSPPVMERPEHPRPTVRIETKIMPSTPTSDVQNSPTPPISPTQVTLAKAPTPWMQKNVKQQEELPEWAKRTNRQDSSSGSESPQQQHAPAVPRQIVVVNTPKPQPQYQPPQAQMRPIPPPQNDRPVPVRIEDRPSVFTAMNEPGSHHQLMNSTPHHLSRWGNPIGQSGGVPQQNQGGAYIVPVQVEGQQQYQAPTNGNYNQMQYRPAEHQANRNGPRGYVSQGYDQPEPGPVQSKSFRVLQKITDTDADQVDGEQLRKLQLTEDDRFLMNKFKEQVDGENYLHKEEDPRYRGAAIPSRAFRYLQTMTDSGDVNSTNSTPRPVNSTVKKSNRNSNTFEEIPVQQYIPPSQQQVQEPKKYTGGAIPSRSFRLLQAMTAPESIATQVTQENLEDSARDIVSMQGNQQGVHYSTYPNPSPTSPPAYWNPEIGWWSYYPSPLYTSYDPYSQQYYYYYPEYYNYDMSTEQRPFNYDSCTTEPNYCYYSNGECWNDYRGTTLSRNSDVYTGAQEAYDSMIVTNDSESEAKKSMEQERSVYPSMNMKHSSEEEDDSEEEKSCSSSREGGDDDAEKNDDKNVSESSDSSCDSDSYVAYSTGLNPLHRRQEIEANVQKEVKDSEYLTDYEKESSFEDEQISEEEETEEEKDEEQEECNEVIVNSNDQEKFDNTIVNVSLPLRFKFSISDKEPNVTTLTLGDNTINKDVETHVEFTLKKSKSQDQSEENQEQSQMQPIFIVTASADDTRLSEQEESKPTKETTDNSEENGKTLLSVQQNHSKEEVTDDEDSGVTSDMSRIISEADTDSECCLPVTTPESTPVPSKRNAKYTRTQTHSRLFRLITDDQLRLPSSLSSHEENSSNSSSLASPDLNEEQYLRPARRMQLPPRPKSLDCGSLFNYQEPSSDAYYQTWKNGDHSQTPSVYSPRLYPRTNVFCPRVRNTKSVAQTLLTKNYNQQSRIKSPLLTTTNNNSNLRMSRRC